MVATRAEHSVQELRQLIAQLEQSGIAEQRPEARALLERSRAVLRQHRPARRRLTGKFGRLLVLAMDALMLGALPFLGLLLLAGGGAWPAPLLGTAMTLWLLFRLRRHAHWLGEGGRWAGFHLGWAYDWLAEAFSLRAMARLDARIMAQEVMWGWRQHRRNLSHRPGLEDVAGYLAAEFGPTAEREFRRAADAILQCRPPSEGGMGPRSRASERLVALRWSALIVVFGRLACSGALWAESGAAGSQPPRAAPRTGDGAGSSAAEPVQAAQEPSPPPPEEDAEASGRAARRADLRDMIRRKRQDITTAFGWKLKTEAEITQRDSYLADIRAEIAAMEQELAKLGG
ncbi:hypothetical protein [Sediminicoccus sp. KRV36]|uniref:hypothetical protein n=1 Tax=Sediminicoccus sp. KRV36 TaxID=3133721 RepID=UPI00200C3499|nr:hypothetical protein [Sediminicoccus rosea]UPY36500.1 hypothetical protein LHU95_20120 [Sediminicoccus rosea]